MPMRFQLLTSVTGAPQTTALWLSISGAMLMAVNVASAQTSTPSSSASSAGVSSTAAPSGTAKKKERKSTAPTASMIDEAIRRSQARAAEQPPTGRTETFGSEEPFTYNPAVKRFDAK